MSRVITFSRSFPKNHQRQGQPTNFVQKIFDSLLMQELISMSRYCELCRAVGIEMDLYILRSRELEPKHHTIRGGHRWKTGMSFSPRFWGDDINPKNGRTGPYNSSQVTFCHDIEIKKTWDFYVDECGIISINGQYFFDYDEEPSLEPSYNETRLAKNDGLTYNDFIEWLIMPCFRKHTAFSGQIICWNEDITY